MNMAIINHILHSPVLGVLSKVKVQIKYAKLQK